MVDVAKTCGCADGRIARTARPPLRAHGWRQTQRSGTQYSQATHHRSAPRLGPKREWLHVHPPVSATYARYFCSPPRRIGTLIHPTRLAVNRAPYPARRWTIAWFRWFGPFSPAHAAMEAWSQESPNGVRSREEVFDSNRARGKAVVSDRGER